MKRIFKFTLFISLLLIGASSLWAENDKTTDKKKPSNPQSIVLKPVISNPLRPRTPSMQEVTCSYMDGYVCFDFAIPEGICDMVLTDLRSGETISATFDSESIEPIYVGVHETAEVSVTTANEHTYCGAW